MPPVRQIDLIYRRGDPYYNDRKLIVGLGKQIQDEIKDARVFSNLSAQFGVDADNRAFDRTDPETSIDLGELANIAMLGNSETLGPEEEGPEALRGSISLVGRGKYRRSSSSTRTPAGERRSQLHRRRTGCRRRRRSANRRYRRRHL
ncbi:hypothetical protein ACFQH2_18460 [Natronoarchaeum sp. GCM10025703]|uniref:hypothetical protein n=1 Tax=unclassified Natronoarchaeum TaxID=2620183 RepID=UPI00360EFFB5